MVCLRPKTYFCLSSRDPTVHGRGNKQTSKGLNIRQNRFTFDSYLIVLKNKQTVQKLTASFVLKTTKFTLMLRREPLYPICMWRVACMKMTAPLHLWMISRVSPFKICLIFWNGQNKVTSASLRSRTALFCLYVNRRIAITPLHLWMIFASFAKKYCIVINGQNKLTSDSLSSRNALFYLKRCVAITPLHLWMILPFTKRFLNN